MALQIIEAINTQSLYQFDGDTAELRLYATLPFITSNGQMVGRGTPIDNQSWYLSVTCQVQPENILYVPSFQIDSTTDGQPRLAKYIAALFTADGAYIGPMPTTNPNGFAIPPPSLMPNPTWGQLAIYNRLPTLVYPPITYAPRDEMYAAIAAAIGQQDNASSTNKGVTALTTDPFDPTFPIAVSASDPLWLELIENIGGEGFYFLSNYASLAAAIADIGALPATLLIDTLAPVTVNLEIPTNVTLFFTNAGGIAPTTGTTVTILGPVTSPPKQIFYNALAGEGTITFEGNAAITELWAEWWGATGDAQRVKDATINGGSAVVNSASGLFRPTDIGKAAVFLGAGVLAGETLVSTIASYQSTTQVTLADVAGMSIGSLGEFIWGTDNGEEFTAVVAAAPNSGCQLTIPSTKAGFMVSTLPTITKPMCITGLGGTLPPFLGAVVSKGARLVWAGTASTMLNLLNVDGVIMQDVIFDGVNVATEILRADYVHVTTLRNCHFLRASDVAFLMGSSGGDGSYLNRITDCLFTGRNGIRLTKFGSGVAGAYLNSWYSPLVIWSGAAGTYGVEILNGDNNGFYDLFVQPVTPSIATAYAYHIGDFTDSFSSYNNYFFHPQMQGGCLIGSSVVGNPNPGTMFGYDQANTDESNIDYFAGSPFKNSLARTVDGLNSGPGGFDVWLTNAGLKIGPTLQFQMDNVHDPGTSIGGFSEDGLLNLFDSATDPGGILFGIIADTATLRIEPGATVLANPSLKVQKGDNSIGTAVAAGYYIHTVAATYTDNQATPNVDGANVFNFGNAAPTTITNFANPNTNQIIYCIFTNGNTTVQANANIKLAGGANFVGTADDTLSLIWTGAVWRELGRSVNA